VYIYRHTHALHGRRREFDRTPGHDRVYASQVTRFHRCALDRTLVACLLARSSALSPFSSARLPSSHRHRRPPERVTPRHAAPHHVLVIDFSATVREGQHRRMYGRRTRQRARYVTSYERWITSRNDNASGAKDVCMCAYKRVCVRAGVGATYTRE